MPGAIAEAVQDHNSSSNFRNEHAYQSWHEEKQSAWLYRELARAEADPVKAKLFDALAAGAEDQSAIWLM